MHASSSLGASTCVADELFERVLVAFEYSWSAYTPNVLAVFSELIEHYGDTGLMLLGAVLYRSVERMDFHEEPAPEPDHAIYHGRLLVRCEACGKYRHGSAWRQRNEPVPEGWRVIGDFCPECDGTEHPAVSKREE